MKTHTKTLLPAIAAASALAAGSACAAITQIDTDFYTFNDSDTAGVASHTVGAADLNSGAAIDLAGASKLVVTVAGEGGGNAVENNTVTSLTYGGVAMNKIVEQGTGRAASVWYLDLDGVTFSNTDFVLNYNTSQTDFGLAAYALAGTAAGYSASANSGSPGNSNTLTITTPTDNEFIVTTMVRNNFDEVESNGADVTGDGIVGVGIESPLVEVFYPDLSGASVAAAYRTAGAAGDYDLVIYDSNNNSTSFVAASFEVVPEPSSLALLGLGGLLIAARRRRD